METNKELATFGAGCFWGVEEAFRTLPGVLSTAVGFMGGDKEDPSYEDVCRTETGHAEVVEITFDPEQINYEQLLEVFWNNHNPTQLNRQGPDVGDQYRSVIFFHDDNQKEAALASKKDLEDSNTWPKPIVTEIVPAQTFYKAEEYHQQYLAKRGKNTCHV